MRMILVVDNDQNMRRAFLRQFRQWGKYEALAVANGVDALSMLKSKKIDLMLLDQMMPGLSGMETFKKIQAEISQAPAVIMTTAFGSISLVVEFMKTGGADFLEKPIDFKTLEIKIESVLLRRKEMAKILIADDSAIIRNGLRQRIQRMGHQVLLAADGEEAWKVLQEGEIDLAILDQHMPKSTGLEILQKIRTSTALSRLPVIFFTVAGEKTSKEEAFASGANDYLVKTVDDMELEMRLRAHLERWQAEEGLRKYEFMANASYDYMTLIGRDYRYQSINNSYLRAQNKSREDVVGSTVAEVWGENIFAKKIKPTLNRCFSGEMASYRTKLDFPALGQRDMEVFYYPYLHNHEVVAAVVISHDITDRKKAEAELLEMRSLSSLSRMTASIAHEMRQPLTAADVDLAEVVELTEKETQKLATSARCRIKEALLIIRSLMKIFRGDRQRTSSEVDVNQELDENLRFFGRKVKGVEIKRDFAVNAQTWTCGNLSRIFINLIGNALDALQNQGELRLTTCLNGENLTVSVEDNGPGIPTEILDKIFEPEFTTKASGTGAGLGLWIARQEAERIGHGAGRITVESKVGKFTRFTVQIPHRMQRECKKCQQKTLRGIQ